MKTIAASLLILVAVQVATGLDDWRLYAASSLLYIAMRLVAIEVRRG